MMKRLPSPRSWLARTPVSRPVARRLATVLELLDDAGLAAITGGHPDLEQCRLGIMDLHRRTIDGEMPDRKAWKALRVAAVAATGRPWRRAARSPGRQCRPKQLRGPEPCAPFCAIRSAHAGRST
ncbi:hypothetical protein ACRAWD_22240 [Caulobacter segnis]